MHRILFLGKNEILAFTLKYFCISMHKLNLIDKRCIENRFQKSEISEKMKNFYAML